MSWRPCVHFHVEREGVGVQVEEEGKKVEGEVLVEEDRMSLMIY